jgi:hypothetical protein
MTRVSWECGTTGIHCARGFAEKAASMEEKDSSGTYVNRATENEIVVVVIVELCFMSSVDDSLGFYGI